MSTDAGAVRQWEQLHGASYGGRGRAFRDLARLHGEAEAVQDAALADAGIAREGDGLAAHGLVQGAATPSPLAALVGKTGNPAWR